MYICIYTVIPTKGEETSRVDAGTFRFVIYLFIGKVS